MSDIKQEVIAFLTKWWVSMACICIGLFGRFSVLLYQGKKITLLQAISGTGVAAFVGYMTSVLCARFRPDLVPLLVPLATLLADKIMAYLLALNWRQVADSFIKRMLK